MFGGRFVLYNSGRGVTDDDHEYESSANAERMALRLTFVRISEDGKGWNLDSHEIAPPTR